MDVATGRGHAALKELVPDTHFMEGFVDLVVATRQAQTTADFAAIALPRITEMFDVAVAFWEYDPAARRIGTVATTLTPVLPDLTDIMISYAHTELWLQQLATRGSPTAMRYSDHATAQQLDRNPLFQEMYLPLGFRDVAQGALRCQGARVTCLQLQSHDRRIADEVLIRFEAVRRVMAAMLPEPPSLSKSVGGHGGGPTRGGSAPKAVRTDGILGGAVEGVDGVWWLGEDPTRVLRPPLTERQVEVMRHVALGLTDVAIGHRLGITIRGVQKHLANVMISTGAHNRTEAAVFLARHGIV